MEPDQNLIDSIKAHFARKSTAHLEEVIGGKEPELWSPEAIAAATEVLHERLSGLSQEPAVPDEDPLPPSLHPDPLSLAFITTFTLMSPLGRALWHFVRTDLREPEDPDFPIPFGSKMAWLALDTTDTAMVADTLGMEQPQPAKWAQGIEAAQQSAVFVTPPVTDWTLVVSTSLFPPDRADDFVKPLLEWLSRQYGDVQYFCSHPDFELHVWARAQQGQLVRGYGWLGQRSLTLWNEGAPTREEHDLGLQTAKTEMQTGIQGERRPLRESRYPDERSVMKLAALWSIDPTTLGPEYKEPVSGLVGKVTWPTAP